MQLSRCKMTRAPRLLLTISHSLAMSKLYLSTLAIARTYLILKKAWRTQKKALGSKVGHRNSQASTRQSLLITQVLIVYR